MKSIKYFLSLLISVMLSFGLTAQCGIVNPEAKDANCIENASYEFKLNFTISDGALDSFDVFANDVFLRRYSVSQLPVTVTNDVYSGFDEDTFKLVDINTDCYEELIVSNPCDCVLFDPKYSKISCNEDSFYILLDFKHLKNSDTFEIGYIDKYLGKYLYENLPVKIGPFHNIDTVYAPYIEDLDDIFCDFQFKINSGGCPECEISNLKLDTFECNDDYNKDMVFSFEHKNSGNQGFEIYVNGEKYATNDFKNTEIIDTSTIREKFELNAVQIECEDTIHIRLVDVQNPDCFFENNFTSFCCELCEVGAIDIRDRECKSDSTFNFIVDFDYAKNRKDSFSLTLDNDYIANYSLAELPLQIENYPISEERTHSVLICLDGGKCCNDVEFDSPDCDYFDCNISGALYSVTYDSMGLYWFNINELVYNNTSDSFSIVGNGRNYGVFNYNDLPIELGSYNCSDSLNLEYIFKDNVVENCEYVIGPGVIDCPFKVGTEEEDISEKWSIYSDSKSIYVYSKELVFDNASIEIYDMLGAVVYRYTPENGKHFSRQTLSSLNTGMYILYFKNNKSKIVKKIYVGEQ